MLLRGVIWSTLGVLLFVSALPATTEEYPTESTTEEVDIPLTTQPEDTREEPQANEVYPDTTLDVNGTIEEVEKILESNPNLPRLSRAEILEILDNLTASQDENVKNELIRHQNSDPNSYKSREEYAKALMLVLPFNAKDMSDTKIQELYTKAPVTKIVDKPGDDDILTGPSYQYKYTPPTISITEAEDDYFPHEVTEPPYDLPSIQSTRFSTSSPYQTLSKTTKEPAVKQAPNLGNPPRKINKLPGKPFKEQESPLDDSYSFSNEPQPTRNSEYFVPTPIEISDNYHDAVYSSIQAIEATTTHHQDSKYPEPSVAPFNPITDSTTVNRQSNFPKSPNNQVIRHRKRRPTGRPLTGYRGTAKPHTTTIPPPTEEPQTSDLQLGLPQDMKQLSVSFEVQDHIQLPNEPQPTLFMTPIPEVAEKVRFSSQYSGNRVTTTTTTTTQESTLDDNVQEALASIGLYPEQVRPQPFYHRVPATQRTTTTTTTEAPTMDLSKAAESLSPEMRDLLISFGLLPSPGGESSSAQTPISPVPLSRAHSASAVIDPSSYVSFKPLPVATAPAGGDMQDFLASFGLVPAADTGRETFHNFRSQKSMATSSKDNMPKHKPIKSVPNFSTEILTDEMREVLESLGILPTSKSKKDPSIADKTSEKAHVFNPSQHVATLNPSEEEAERLHKLLKTIKKFVKENATLTPEQMAVIDASFPLLIGSDNTTAATITTTTSPSAVTKTTETKIVSLHQLGNGPDPLALEELLQLYDANKNEVKRQQPNDTSSNTTDSATLGTEQTVPSFDALAESFGGGETAASDAKVEEQLPPAKPNGLYFLLDWNSFLEVGEEGKNKVNIRVAPKVGDPRNFLRVTVP